MPQLACLRFSGRRCVFTCLARPSPALKSHAGRMTSDAGCRHKPVVGRTKTASRDLDSPWNASQPYTRYSFRSSFFFRARSIRVECSSSGRNRISLPSPPDKWRGNDKILWEMKREKEREGGEDGLQIQSRRSRSLLDSFSLRIVT